MQFASTSSFECSCESRLTLKEPENNQCEKNCAYTTPHADPCDLSRVVEPVLGVAVVNTMAIAVLRSRCCKHCIRLSNLIKTDLL